MKSEAHVLVSGLGMITVAVAAALAWKRLSRMSSRPMWIGAALWAIAVPLKIACAFALNPMIFSHLTGWQSNPLLLMLAGCYFGVQSVVFEIGLTHLAVMKWRQLGRDAPTAVGIGVGAGAIEAFLLGLLSLGAALFVFSGSTESDDLTNQLNALTAPTPLYFLMGPVERSIAVLGHAASRALVLLGSAHGRTKMVLSGWALFALTDGVAGAFILAGQASHMSMWWVELAVAPFALVSIPILRWCWKRWPVPPVAAAPVPA
jgi:uncharacterized membrane protein YhfC